MFDSAKFDTKFTEAVEYFRGELKKVHTGRAQADMLDGLSVDAYGTKMPLSQVANVTVPEATQLLVTPFDPANLGDIALAIRNEQSLGLNPTDDGRNIRVNLPPVTEERRRAIVKHLGEKMEDARVAVRNIRQDALKLAKQMKDDKELSEDDVARITKEIDATVAEQNQQLEEILRTKEQEVMTI